MSAAFVLDGSVTLAWFFAGEATAATDLLLDQSNQGGRAVGPQHWALEVGNMLRVGERRRRCSEAESVHFLGLLRSLEIELDPETGDVAFSAALSLARSQGLTLYDAAYLELATRSNRPLATLDRQLRSAAAAVGVQCVPPLP